MVKLIIRDDDCNYFTHPVDLEKAYRQLPDFPVSFAVVPTVTDVTGGCPETKGNEVPMPIGENTELVEWLKSRYALGHCDILLHGITHGYRFSENGIKIPEMVWRNNDKELVDLISRQKQYLESVFDIPITCFVAPSNRLMRNGIRAVYKNEMNYSGIVPLDFQRDIDIRSISNYIKRMWVRTIERLPYPNVLDYSTHKELNACNTTDLDYLKRMFSFCVKIGSPMAINVHYWHIRDYPNQYKGFFDFIKYALDYGALPARMRDCL